MADPIINAIKKVFCDLAEGNLAAVADAFEYPCALYDTVDVNVVPTRAQMIQGLTRLRAALMEAGMARIETNILSVTPPDGDNCRVALSNSFLNADGECFFYRRANFFAALRANCVRIYMIEGLSAPVERFGWKVSDFEAV